jgi:acetyl esterase/lipase
MKQMFLVVLSFLCLQVSAQEFSNAWKDVNYANDTISYHNMDIYLPKIKKDKYPVVVYIYGSAWLSNRSKGADLGTIGAALLDAGFAVVMPNHRASYNALFPAQVHDIKAVVRFLRANADKYSIDTNFIGVSGSSSGGNLAAMMGVTGGVTDFSIDDANANLEGNVGAYAGYSSSVDAVVAWFPPTNMLIMNSCGGTDMNHDDVKSPASLYIGGAIQENKAKTLLASPTSYVSSSNPPFLIFHGNNDRVVPHCQSEILYEALKKADVDVEFVLVEGGGHGPGVHVKENIDKMVEFFNDKFKSLNK